MQNQKKNGVSGRAVRLAGLFLVLFCAAAVLLPAKTLFTGDGFFAEYIHFQASRKMYIEIAILAVLLAGGLLLLKRGRSRIAWLAVIVLAFSWIHVVFLPMIVSAAYLVSLLAIGRFLRKQVFFRKTASRRCQKEESGTCGNGAETDHQGRSKDTDRMAQGEPWFAVYMDFLFGSSFAIVLYCLLSVFGVGRIVWMRILLYGLGTGALGLDFPRIFRQCIWWRERWSWMLDGREKEAVSVMSVMKEGSSTGKCKERSSWEVSRRVRQAWTLAAAWCVLMFLIQLGRLNIALDFDTLWYGVRSQYIVAGGSGLYENPGLVGMVYVYSKGFEVLTLPLCDLASHSYLTCFNLWLAVLGIGAMVWNAGLLADNGKQKSENPTACCKALPGITAVVLTVSVPGIMNMGLTAKADLITWLLQLMMLGCFFEYLQVYESQNRTEHQKVSQRRRPPEGIEQVERSRADSWQFLAGAAGSYLLSLTMKPTSLVFSTAVFGMMGLYLLWFWFREGGAASDLFHHMVRLIGSLCLSLGALIGIWARTMRITGMPVTSVFTSIFARFGFQMKYPFATSELPQNYQEESTFHVMVRRLWQMLMQPQGEDMGHVILAWGSSLMAVLIVMLLLYGMFRGFRKHLKFYGDFEARMDSSECQNKKESGLRQNSSQTGYIGTAEKVIFFPFAVVCFVSLTMLYQIDGNYFMLLYSMLILGACRALVYFREIGFYSIASKCLAPVLGLNLIITAISSWAWTAGFSEIHLLNKGRVNHRAQEQMRMEEKGNTLIWQELSQDPGTRVISFGNHPYCLQFPCNVQSYKDITAPWGNVELVNSPEAFETYMEYAKTDYVYAEAGYLGPGNWEWSLDLLRKLIQRGSLTDLFFENGNMLARVSDTPVPEEEAQKNLETFEQTYLFYVPESQ